MNEEENKQSLSRRDFLRRASKEAVDTGTKLVPGGNLARQALGMAPNTTAPWWNVVAKWRQRRTDEEPKTQTQENETGTDD